MLVLDLVIVGLALLGVNFAYAIARSKIVGKTLMSKRMYDLLIGTKPSKMINALLTLSFIEELIFRVLLIGVLTYFFGHVLFFFCLSAVLFALLHLPNYKHQGRLKAWTAIPMQLLGGIVFGQVFLLFGFLSAWLLHFGYNFVAVAATREYVRRNPDKLLFVEPEATDV